MVMQLGRLCFVLPQDLYEDSDEFPKPVSKRPKSHHRRHCCGGELFSTIRRSLHTFLSESCFCHQAKTTQFSGMFHDTAGADFSDKVATGVGNPKIFSYAELYIGSKGFSEDELLGSGGFGRVYRAVLPSDGTVAAVKCLAEKGDRFEKTFEAELAAVAHLRHRNLVRLRGWCGHEDQLLLVYDFMPNRSLDRILFRRPEKAGSPAAAVLTWKRRDNIVKGLAAALFYLHEQLETQIIHRDVKASNVMLDSHYNARLGDFGLARWLEHDLVYQNPKSSSSFKHQQPFHLSETTRIGGTIGYLPPESFQKKSTATAKSDVFSFGIVLMEVVSGRRALDLSFSDDKIVLLDWIRRLSDEGMLLQAVDIRIEDGSYRLSDLERFLHVGLLCTLQNPFSRPNMKWVIEAISGKMYGKLPVVPSFKSHPLYITLSSSSDSSSGTTTTASKTNSNNSVLLPNSSLFQTANTEGTTIYMTADDGGGPTTEQSFRKQASSFMVVDTPNEIPFSKLVTATNNFSDSNLVAEIDFGTAYHGFLSENKQHVLVKRLGMKTCPALRVRFSNELQNLTRLRHRNLVQLRGWCTEHGEMLIVYDYSAKRLLSNILFRRHNGHTPSPLRWHHRYNIVRSLASAIRYLHEEWDEQVIHKSITTSAIVLDHDMNPRLSSFALAEFLTRKELGNGNHHVVLDTKRSVRGIFGYISPEYMKSGEATPMADIYSFGVVLLELVTGQSAVDFRRPDVLLVGRMLTLDMQKEFFEDVVVDMRLNGLYDPVELSRLVKLGITCTRSDAKSRPTIGQIVRILDGNDECLMEIFGLKKESRAEWTEENDAALELVRRIQSLGIQ